MKTFLEKARTSDIAIPANNGRLLRLEEKSPELRYDEEMREKQRQWEENSAWPVYDEGRNRYYKIIDGTKVHQPVRGAPQEIQGSSRSVPLSQLHLR